MAPDLEALAETYRAAAAAAAAAADDDDAADDTDDDTDHDTDHDADDADHDADADGAADETAGDDAEEEASSELWLAREARGWRLEVVGYGDDDDGEIRAIPLNHREATAAAPTLTASVTMTNTEEGQLMLRWGTHVWNADFRFDELPERPPTQRVSGRGQEREASSDTSDLSRGVALAERNESALILPGGERLSLLYWKGIDVEDEDYGRIRGDCRRRRGRARARRAAADQERCRAPLRRDEHSDRQPRARLRRRLRHLAPPERRRLAARLQPRARFVGNAVRPGVRCGRNSGRLCAWRPVVPAARRHAGADRRGTRAGCSSTGVPTSGRRTSRSPASGSDARPGLPVGGPAV